MASNWKTRLEAVLTDNYGKTKGRGLADKYTDSFSPGYRSAYDARTAAADIEHLDQLSDNKPLRVTLYYQEDGENPSFSAWPK